MICLWQRRRCIIFQSWLPYRWIAWRSVFLICWSLLTCLELKRISVHQWSVQGLFKVDLLLLSGLSLDANCSLIHSWLSWCYLCELRSFVQGGLLNGHYLTIILFIKIIQLHFSNPNLHLCFKLLLYSSSPLSYSVIAIDLLNCLRNQPFHAVIIQQSGLQYYHFEWFQLCLDLSIAIKKYHINISNNPKDHLW